MADEQFNPIGLGLASAVEQDATPKPTVFNPIGSGLAQKVEGDETPPSRDPRRQLSFDEFKASEEALEARPITEKVVSFGEGLVSGLGEMAKTVVKSVPETYGALREGEFETIGKTLVEGGAKAIFEGGEMIEAVSGRAKDLVLDEDLAWQRRYDRYLDDLTESEMAAEGLAFPSEEVLPNTATTASIFLDPLNLAGLGITSKTAKALKLGKFGETAGLVMDLPNKATRKALEASAKVSGKASELGLKLASLPLKGVSAIGKATQVTAGSPRIALEAMTPKRFHSALMAGQVFSGPVGQALLGTELVGAKLAKSAKAAKELQHIASILGNPSRKLRFLQEVSLDPKVKKGVRRLAASVDSSRAVDVAMNAISNSVGAATLQGIFAKMATDDPEAIGQAVGGGIGFGGISAPFGPKRKNVKVTDKADADANVVTSETERPISILEREIERQEVEGKKIFHNEKKNLADFNKVFSKKKSDAIEGREGTTFSEGTKEFYARREGPEVVGYMDAIENAIQDNKVNNVTFVRTASTKEQARRKMVSKIEEMSANVVWVDTQLPKPDPRNKTLTTGRGINVDVLRAIANERGLDINDLGREVQALKDNVRNGGRIGDKNTENNQIVKFLNEGEQSLLIQVEPRNIISMGEKIVTPTKDSPKAIEATQATPSGVKSDNQPDFKGGFIKSKSLPRGRGERITARFKTGADRSLFDFHGIESRKKGNAMNRESNAPSQAKIKQEQEYLASVYGVPVDQVPRLASDFNSFVKAKGKALHEKGEGGFDAPDVSDFL